MRTLSVSEAAELLHLHPKRVQGLARSGKLPAVRVGRKWLFPADAIERLLGRPASATITPAPREPELEISARNRLRGTITALTVDGLMAEVRLDIGGQEIVSVITRSSVERLGLAVGGRAFALIKATEVMIGREERSE
jgi:molybdopterin-binding protein